MERLFCIEPPESNPEAGLTMVALRLSPAIVVNAGTTIGSDASSYVPAFTKMIAGLVAVGVEIFVQAYFILLYAVSTDPPLPDAS